MTKTVSSPPSCMFLVRSGKNVVGPVTLAQMHRGVDAGVIPQDAEAQVVGSIHWTAVHELLTEEKTGVTAPKEINPAPRKLWHTVVLWAAVGCGAVLVGVLSVVALKVYLERDTEEVLVTTPKDFNSDYGSNAIMAEKKYVGKKIELTGIVGRVGSDEGKAYVTLGEEGLLSRLLGQDDVDHLFVLRGLSVKDASKLKRGDEITVVCRFRGERALVYSPVLESCQLD